jgi:hypothetical protein
MTETISNANAAASTLFLGHNGEWWDFWLIVSVIVAALVATAVGVTTAGSIIAHKREAAATQEAFDEYKLETGKEIAEAEVRAAEAQLALEQFKAPRVLTSEQSQKLSGALKEYGPKRIDVFVYPGVTYDTFGYGNQIYIAFLNAGWKAKFFSVIGGAVDVPQGVGISGAAGIEGEPGLMKRPLLSMELEDIFRSAGIEANRWRSFLRSEPPPYIDAHSSSSWDQGDVAGIRLLVGPKPWSNPKKGPNTIIVK